MSEGLVAVVVFAVLVRAMMDKTWRIELEWRVFQVTAGFLGKVLMSLLAKSKEHIVYICASRRKRVPG